MITKLGAKVRLAQLQQEDDMDEAQRLEWLRQSRELLEIDIYHSFEQECVVAEMVDVAELLLVIHQENWVLASELIGLAMAANQWLKDRNVRAFRLEDNGQKVRIGAWLDGTTSNAN